MASQQGSESTVSIAIEHMPHRLLVEPSHPRAMPGLRTISTIQHPCTRFCAYLGAQASNCLGSSRPPELAMQVTSCQHRSLQGPAVGCGSPCRQPSRQKASARGRPTNAASAQDVDQVSADSSQHSANPMEFEELSDIIKMVHSTDIVEFELRSKKFSLAVRKKEALVQPEPMYLPGPQGGTPPPQYQSQPQGIAAPPPPSPPTEKAPSSGGGAGGGNGSAPSAEPAVEGYKMASPMAGSFYRSPAPGEAAFCKEGDKVSKGQTVCIIEAMKLMNEIEADVSGTIVKWLVDNGSQITPGQELLVIKQ